MISQSDADLHTGAMTTQTSERLCKPHEAVVQSDHVEAKEQRQAVAHGEERLLSRAELKRAASA